MSENEKPWEQDLQHLGERIREDLDLLHPVTEKRFQAVYEVVSQQWHKEQARLKAGGKPRTHEKKQEQSHEKGKTRSESPDQWRGHSH